ncbi:hypothetical protein ACSSS7_000487 [Eimeria intestinalis]
MVTTIKQGLPALIMAALAIVSVGSTSGSPITCPGNTPVELRSCTLDLKTGEEAQFQCSNPSPKSFPKKMRDWNGAEKNIADLLGEGSSVERVGSNQSNIYKVKISDKAKTSVAGVTCSIVSPSTTKQSPGTPTAAEAQKLAVRSLVIRVNGGPAYAREKTISQDNAVGSPTAEGVNAVVTSALLAAAALLVAV